MTIDKFGIALATKDELFELWLHDDDLLRLFDFTKFVMWCKIGGITVAN